MNKLYVRRLFLVYCKMVAYLLQELKGVLAKSNVDRTRELLSD